MKNTYRQQLNLGNTQGEFYSLPQLEKEGVGAISRLPICLRIVLESVLRHCGQRDINEDHVAQLANWQPTGKRLKEIPFVVGARGVARFYRRPLIGRFSGHARCGEGARSVG